MVTSDPSTSTPGGPGNTGVPVPANRPLDYLELESLADKIIEMMKRELQIENEREGRNP